MEIFNFLKDYLKKEKCDYIYINHTNRFFSEYVDVSKSSRFLLTKFSGSTGDALVSKDKIYLFVDSRYWQQAEMETEKDLVKVMKLGSILSMEQAIISITKPKECIAFFEDKTSFQLYEKFKTMGYNIKLLDTDLVADYFKVKEDKLSADFKKIPLSIAGKSTNYKIKKIQNKLKKNEAAIISSLEDVSYLLNLTSDNFEYSSIIFGKIIILKDDYKFFTSDEEFEKELKLLAKNNKITKFLIDKANLSIKYKKYFKNCESAKFLATLRSKKFNAEIEHMQKCFERTDNVLKDVFNELSKRTFKEDELFDFVNQKFAEYGAKTNSFKTILASGANSSIVHFSHPTDRKIKDGEFVLLDCGGLYEGGYATDITRTFLKGKPSDIQKRVYTTVLKAFLNAYNADLKKYKTFYEIDKIARDIINKARMEGFTFGHGLGHSVGRSVHDGLPTLSPSPFAKMKIKPNMVFTIEPGMYKPEWGGVRLENTVHTLKINGKLTIKSFSKAPFQKELIDFSLLTETEKKYLNEWVLI